MSGRRSAPSTLLFYFSPRVIKQNRVVVHKEMGSKQTHGSSMFPPSRAQGCKQMASRFPGSAATPRSSSISVTGPGGVNDTWSLSPDGNSRMFGNASVSDRSKAVIVDRCC